MRIALVHNTSAGSEDHTDAELTKLLRKAGHEVAHVVSRLGELTRLLQEDPCELVVIAGGDGTVGRVACELAGWQVPLSILPLGTANNTALSLELPRRPRRLAEAWHQATAIPFDLAFVHDGALRERFSEAVGWGVFAETIGQAKSVPPLSGVKRTLRRDRRLFRGFAAELPARHYSIEADGRDHSGDYLLVEVMNVRYLGPRLLLSPTSDPGDGMLELLLVKEHQRAELMEAARTGLANSELLPAIRARHVRVVTDDQLVHQDGRLRRYSPGRRSFTLEVEPGAISYWR